MCGVTKGRVSQWLADGQISGKAIVGEGRAAMIDSEIAHAQLKERLDTTQRFGENGLNTKLGPDVLLKLSLPPTAEAEPAALAAPPAPGILNTGWADRPNLPMPPAREGEDPETVEARLKAQKLEQNEILTRKLRTEERARDGVYMDTAGARGTMGRIASEMMKIFEGALPDMASALAAKFQISQRESLHQLRADFRAIREQLAAVHVEARTSTPETVETPE